MDAKLTDTITSEEANLHTIKVPKFVGGYRIGGSLGLRMNFTKKPIWFHRKMMKLCLGWEWVDFE